MSCLTDAKQAKHVGQIRQVVQVRHLQDSRAGSPTLSGWSGRGLIIGVVVTPGHVFCQTV